MPMLQSSIHIFQRVARRCTNPYFSCLLAEGPMVYATDTAIALRSSAFTLPGVIQDSPSVDTIIRAFDKYANVAGLRLAAIGPKAKCPGEYPTISEKLHAYVRFAKNQGEKSAFYPVGDCMVNASLLADVLTAIPDACVYAVPGDPFKPLFFRGEYAEGLLFPVRLPMRDILHSLQLLADYQRESGEQGADPSRPFMTISLDKIAEQAAEETRRQQEQEREEYIRQCQAEETAQREQAEKEKAEKAREHAETLADLRRKLQSCRDAEIAVDGEVLAELMETCGVSVPGRVKGWIRQKLRSVTISDEGHMCAYRFARARKGERGSDAVYTYVDRLLDNLASADTSDVPAAPADLPGPCPEQKGAESGIRSENLAPVSAAVCPAMHDLLALSAGTLSTLARQKNLPDSEKYSALEVFHEKIVRAALTLDVSQYANWQQLFEAAYSVAFPAPAPEQKAPQTEKQLQTVGSVCHMVYCTGPNPLGEQKTMDFPSLAECREWIAAHRSADLARSCGYTVYAGSHDYVLRDGDGFPVVLLTYSRAAPVPPQNGAKSDDRPANLSRKRKKPNPEKRHEAARKANADKALLQTFVESDLSRFGHVKADTQSALQFQGYFWDGSKLRKCKKPLHVFSVSTG